MPFIDDELLWCPDNDGKMVDLTQCLQVTCFFLYMTKINEKIND